MCLGHPVKDMFRPPPFLSGGPVFDPSEGGHKGGRTPKPASGFIHIYSLHITFLRVLTEIATLCAFVHRAMEGGVTVAPLEGLRQHVLLLSRSGRARFSSTEGEREVPATASARWMPQPCSVHRACWGFERSGWEGVQVRIRGGCCSAAKALR